MARLVGPEVTQSKIGKRHVQGKTKAGGWSQHRFANRRDNQARVAFEAAAHHVEEILLPHSAGLHLLATGGDRKAVATTLSGDRLAGLRALPQQWLGGVSDPRRDVLDSAVARVCSLQIDVWDSQPEHPAT